MSFWRPLFVARLVFVWITLKRYPRAKNRKDKISRWCSTRCTSRRIGWCNSWNDLYNGWLVQKQFDGMHHSQHHVSMVRQYDDILRTFIRCWWTPRLRNQVLNPGHSHISYDFSNTLGSDQGVILPTPGSEFKVVSEIWTLSNWLFGLIWL